MRDSMNEPGERRLCLIPKLSGTGGTTSFQLKMLSALKERGIATTLDLDHPNVEAALIVGGTRDLLRLWHARKSGVRIFQRLDGINWIHKKRRTGLYHYLKAERANLLLSFTRNHLATGVVYQSHFVHRWWESVYGATNVPHAVVYNGVDLDLYKPQGVNERPLQRVRLLVVEGRLAGGYELGLEHAVAFANVLQGIHAEPIELMVVGDASDEVIHAAQGRSLVPIHWTGSVPRERIPEIDRSAHLLFAADIHPACPNAVIEALACGLPVVGFDTGALGEIVDQESGRIVAYGADPWNLEAPDFEGLALAARTVLSDLESFRSGARRRAEDKFGLDRMVDGYLEAIGW